MYSSLTCYCKFMYPEVIVFTFFTLKEPRITDTLRFEPFSALIKFVILLTVNHTILN